MQVRAGAGRRDVRACRRQLPLLHFDPAGKQQVPTLEQRVGAGSHGTPDHTAGADRIAGVYRGQGNQRCRAVRNDLAERLFGGNGLAQFCHRDRIRLIHGQQQPLGEVARATRCHRRWTGILESQGGTRRRQVAVRGEHDRGGRAHHRVRVWAQPAEQLGCVSRVAVVDRDAGRNPHRGSAFGGIRGAEQIVG